MRKVIEVQNYNYEVRDAIKAILDINRLPRFIIIETIEEEE